MRRCLLLLFALAVCAGGCKSMPQQPREKVEPPPFNTTPPDGNASPWGS